MLDVVLFRVDQGGNPDLVRESSDAGMQICSRQGDRVRL